MSSPFFAPAQTSSIAPKEPNGTSPEVRLKNHTQLPQPEGWTDSQFWLVALKRAGLLVAWALFMYAFVCGAGALRHWLIGGAQ